MLDHAKLKETFASAANGLNVNQQKNTSQLTHNQLNYSWRRMINALDEMVFMVQHSSMEGFNYDEARGDYAENFSLSPNPHQPNLHPIHNTVFANVHNSTLVVRRPSVLHTGPWFSWENIIAQPTIGVTVSQSKAAAKAIASYLRATLAPQAQTVQPQAAQAQAAQPHVVSAPHLRPSQVSP